MFENKLVNVVTSLQVNDRGSRIRFVHDEQKCGHQARTDCSGKCVKAQDWRMLADVGGQLQVPQCIVVTAIRTDMVLYSGCEHIVYFIGLLIQTPDTTVKPSRGVVGLIQ